MTNKTDRGLGPRCPHCEHAAETRTSRQVSRTVREHYHRCRNLECGHTFASQWVVVRTISPSNTPHPGVHLPIAPPRAPMRRGQPAPANDDLAPAANDNLRSAAEA